MIKLSFRSTNKGYGALIVYWSNNIIRIDGPALTYYYGHYKDHWWYK